MHDRLRPKKHRFSYSVASWLLDIDELQSLDKKLHLFSVGQFNVISFYPNDYGDKSKRPLRHQVEHLLNEAGVAKPDHIRLLCYPRMFGYVFNPISVYFCYESYIIPDSNEPSPRLSAIIYEVSNTFKERHSYVIPTKSDRYLRSSPVICQTAEKKLHVSPFFPMACFYRFYVRPPSKDIQLSISLNDNRGRLFTAIFHGKNLRINDALIVKLAIIIPLQTLKVVGIIYWEAMRLWLKRVPIFKHKKRDVFFSSSKGSTNISVERNAKDEEQD